MIVGKMKAAPHYFVSYCREDKEFVLRLVERLRGDGVSLWMDTSDIRIGEPWNEKVERALQACEAVIVVLSPHSVESENVINEIGYAKQANKRFVPVVYEKCLVPMALVWLNRIDLSHSNLGAKEDEGLRELMELLQSKASVTQAPAPDRGITSTPFSVEDALDLLSIAPRNLIKHIIAALPTKLSFGDRFFVLTLLKDPSPAGTLVGWLLYCFTLVVMLLTSAPLWMIGGLILAWLVTGAYQLLLRRYIKRIRTQYVRPYLANQLPRRIVGEVDAQRAKKLWQGVEPVLWELTGTPFSDWPAYLERTCPDPELRRRVEAMLSIPVSLVLSRPES